MQDTQVAKSYQKDELLVYKEEERRRRQQLMAQ